MEWTSAGETSLAPTATWWGEALPFPSSLARVDTALQEGAGGWGGIARAGNRPAVSTRRNGQPLQHDNGIGYKCGAIDLLFGKVMLETEKAYAASNFAQRC